MPDGVETAGALLALPSLLTRETLEPAPIGFYFAKLWYFAKLYQLIFTVAALPDGDHP